MGKTIEVEEEVYSALDRLRQTSETDGEIIRRLVNSATQSPVAWLRERKARGVTLTESDCDDILKGKAMGEMPIDKWST